MTIKYPETFLQELIDQVIYIAEDKPMAAFKFKDDLEQLIQEIPKHPLKHRKSIYFNDEMIRDLIFKGYSVTYRINRIEESIEVLSLTNYQNR